MTTEELRVSILELVRPTGGVGLRPAGVLAQLKIGRLCRREREIRESLRWLADRGFLEKTASEVSPSDVRVRVSAKGIDFLEARDNAF